MELEYQADAIQVGIGIGEINTYYQRQILSHSRKS